MSSAPASTVTRFAGAERLPSDRLELWAAADFLSVDECAAFRALIEAQRHPSQLADAGDDTAFRTSETCYLDGRLDLVRDLDLRLSRWTGIAPRFGEPVQGQRYAVGQQFKPHTDYFDADGRDYEKFCAVAGQRTWTAMIYLNEPEEGGETYFPRVDVGFMPSAGALLAWNNRRDDGAVNPDTLHQGMPVIAGTKYILTKWYRERPWA